MRARPAEQGFALLIVLWALALSALLLTTLTAAGRNHLELAHNLATDAQAQAAVDGAIQQAVFGLLTPGSNWRADGTPRRLRIGSFVIDVTATDEGARMNLNSAPAELLSALLLHCSANPSQDSTLAAAIVDWHTSRTAAAASADRAAQYAAAGRDYAPPGSAFRTVDELRAVIGMTPALFECLKPHVTVYTDTDPDTSSADAVVAAAIQAAERAGNFVEEGDVGDTAVARIAAVARGAGGVASSVTAVVRFNEGGSPPYEILAWRRAID